MMPIHTLRAAWQGAFVTVAALFGGLIVGVAAGFGVFELFFDSSDPAHPPAIGVVLAALPALAGFGGGSAAWGVAMGRRAGRCEPRRMALAGALGFGPITVALGIALAAVEPMAVAGLGGALAIHRIFTLLFVPSAFLIAGVSAGAVGLGLRRPDLARALFWQVGLGGAAGFLAVNMLMEAAGWVVGAPGAAERATMLTVMFAGNLGAALAGGAIMAIRLDAEARAKRAA
jgi:hypothetical protein